jgi:hypothetical protein
MYGVFVDAMHMVNSPGFGEPLLTRTIFCMEEMLKALILLQLDAFIFIPCCGSLLALDIGHASHAILRR